MEIILIKNYKEQVMLKDLKSKYVVGYEGYCNILNREVIWGNPHFS